MTLHSVHSTLLFATICFLVLKEVNSMPPSGKFTPKCRVGEGIYNPDNAKLVPWITVDLDAPPEERFKKVVVPFIEEMKDVVATVKQAINGISFGILVPLVEKVMKYAHKELFPEVYRREIEGISAVSGISVADLAMMNIFYELSRFCTSIVAQTTDGDLWHGRNLDFGQPFIWDVEKRTWKLTSVLKKVTVNINYMKNGKLLFKGTTFAGHVGVITGMRPNGFTLSMNARLKPDILNVFAWLDRNYTNKDLHFVMWAEREVFEHCRSYAEAQAYLSNTLQLAGDYYILGGKRPGEGVILVRNETSLESMVKLDPQGGFGRWYLLQTNYDPGTRPLFIDDRITPGNYCMRQMGPDRLAAAGLYEVLTSKTNLNKSTVHTVIMHIASGTYETYIQDCPDPCWFI
uniref:Ceramidase n=1 Tax=Panagrellus redivivus TaxID=6233 RepID=A0A7E4VFS6_PANRE